MAGAGYKLFNTGDVLTAAQVNTYLQEQTVMVFASSAARTSALSGVLAEGMVSYLQDTNAVEVYNGSAWVGVSGAGDVTEVQAGTGISVASGTGPIPVVTNTMATTINAAGDLIYGTGNDAFTRLGIGTAGQVLKVNSGATAPEWGAAAAGGGKVLQVVSATYSTETTIASTTYTDSGLTLAITPSLSSSKVLVLVSQTLYATSTDGDAGAGMKLLRGATDILNAGGTGRYNTIYMSHGYTSGTPNKSQIAIIGSLNYLDSPSTTSSTTYKTQLAVESTGASGQIVAQGNASVSSITLLEIGA